MILLYPWGLLGLITLPIIVLLHRRRPILGRRVVASLRFWRITPTERLAGQRKRIAISKLLAVQLLVAGLFTLALAEPVIQVPEWLGQTGRRHHIILLDTSMSMSAKSGEVSRFEAAREDLLNLVRGAGPRERFSLITFGGSARLVAPKWLSRSELIGAILGLRAAQLGADLQGGMALAEGMLGPEDDQIIEIFTDAAFDFDGEDAILQRIAWHLYSSGDSNQAIIALDVEQIDSNQSRIVFRVANYSTQPFVRGVQVIVDGNRILVTEASVPAEGLQDLDLVIPMSGTVYEVRLGGEDALAEDDVARLYVQEQRRPVIAVITASPDWWEKRLGGLNLGEVRMISPQEYLAQSGIDLVIFDGFLPESLPEGIVLVLDPPADSDLLDFGEMRDSSGSVRTREPGFLGASELQGLRVDRLIDFEVDALTDQILADMGGLPVWVRRELRAQQIYISLAYSHSSNLREHPSFPIVLARLAAMAAAIPSSPGAPVSTAEISMRLQQVPWTQLTITLDALGLDLEKSDLVGLSNWDTFGDLEIRGETLAGLSVSNVVALPRGSSRDSDIRLRPWAASLEDFQKSGEAIVQEISISPAFYVLALVFALYETFLFWRNQ